MILTDHGDKVSVAFVGDDVRKIIQSLRTSKWVAPWYSIESTGGYRFAFFKGRKHLGNVEAGWGVYWIGPGTYVDTSPSLDPLFERLRKENISAH